MDGLPYIFEKQWPYIESSLFFGLKLMGLMAVIALAVSLVLTPFLFVLRIVLKAILYMMPGKREWKEEDLYMTT